MCGGGGGEGGEFGNVFCKRISILLACFLLNILICARVADPHSFHPDPDPAEYRSGSNTDTDPIRIQGFNDQKLKKITAEKKLNFFLIKNYNLPITRPP